MHLNFNKSTGPKPSKHVLHEASTLARIDTGDYMAVAMSMRPNGATQSEIVHLLGKPHRNKIKALVNSKVVKRLVLPDDTRSARFKLVMK